jgi:hypothetical protein
MKERGEVGFVDESLSSFRLPELTPTHHTTITFIHLKNVGVILCAKYAIICVSWIITCHSKR